MIATRDMLRWFAAWNARWGAPNGGPRLPRGLRWLDRTVWRRRRRGPFAFQTNSSTRQFEYPWAYDAVVRAGGPLEIVEIGGGLSGLQFVLAAEGHRVTNVDPGRGWRVSADEHAALCQAFAAPVRLVTETVERAALPDASADVVVSVSVLEHLGDDEIAAIAAALPRVLRPGGRLVLTADLFLDIEPFDRAPRNRWGRNVDLCRFLADSGLRLVLGERSQLHGFPEFDPDGVLAALPRFVESEQYPHLAQCLVAERRD